MSGEFKATEHKQLKVNAGFIKLMKTAITRVLDEIKIFSIEKKMQKFHQTPTEIKNPVFTGDLTHSCHTFAVRTEEATPGLRS